VPQARDTHSRIFFYGKIANNKFYKIAKKLFFTSFTCAPTKKPPGTFVTHLPLPAAFKMEGILSQLPIHLPWFISVHAWGLTTLGLYYVFKVVPPGKRAGHTPALGIATIGIGVAYLFTSYMPIEQNQWLHASVPVRLLLAALLILRALIGTGLTVAEKKSLLSLAIYDGLGGAVLGLWLGRWDGRIALSSS
jgi:hypothetical protein